MCIYIYIYIYIHTYTHKAATKEAQAQLKAAAKARGKILHTRNHKSETPLANATESPLDISSKHPLHK